MKKLAIVLFSAVVLAGCIPGLTQTPPASPEPKVQDAMMEEEKSMNEGEGTAQDEAMMEGDVRIVEVTGNPFSFSPNAITVKKGEKVAVKFVNAEGFHDFVIDELDVRTEMIPQGSDETVTIPTETAGEFEFYCSVGDHRARGMFGTLVIEE